LDRPATKLAFGVRELSICSVLFLATWVVFGRAVENGFVNYDDPTYLTNNPTIQHGLTWNGMAWAFTANVSANWHPLTLVSLETDWSLFGANPAGHHAVSVFLHALNAMLAFLVLRRLTGSFWTSALSAALFACHPLRVESVAWASERKDVLSGFFGLLTLWFYAIYAARSEQHVRGAGRSYALSLFSFTLGLLAKPMLVTIPGVLALIDFWPLGRRLDRMRIWMEKVPFVGLSIASCLATYLAQRKGGAVAISISLKMRLETAAMAVPRYIGKIFWPENLSPLYPYPKLWPISSVAAAVLFIVAVSVAAVAWRRKHPWILTGWFWFLGMLIPVLGFVQVGLQSMADRYTYMPVLGLELASLWSLRDWVLTPGAGPWARRAAAIGSGAALVALSAMTWEQVGEWRDSGSLWRHAIETTANNAVAFNNLGSYLEGAGDRTHALPNYQKAVDIEPDYADAENNLGQALTSAGEPAEAVKHLRRALELRPNLVAARVNLGEALMRAGKIEEAVRELESVLADYPDTEPAVRDYGMALAMNGDTDKAISRLRSALQMDPGDAVAHGDLGMIFTLLHRWPEAVAEDRMAVRLKPNEAPGHYNLGVALQQSGSAIGAISEFGEAIRLMPVNPNAHANRGLLLAQIGRKEEALSELRTALQQNPGLTQVSVWIQTISSGP
jgi:tetratricopeptide (TPR) repeat protein